MTSYSVFQRRLQAGQVVVTGELAPPKGAARATLERLALGMRDTVDAINLTDNQRGVGRMSALGAGVVMRQLGIEPIVQMTCQHRNRIAVQADVLSGAVCGIDNFLCMTGDHPKSGDHPEAKNVLDLNSLKKIQSGAEFIQTQIIFDIERFKQWMADVRAAGLHQQVHIIAGVMVIRSAGSAQFLRDHLPGSRVPDWVIERMAHAENAEQEGVRIAGELTQELLAIEGVRGIHIMSVGWTRAIPWVVEAAGLLPRPPAPEAI